MSDDKLSHRLYNITPLQNDGSNFQTWKFRMELILGNRDLWGIVSGAEPRPENAHATTLKNWLKREREARAQILLTLEDDPLNGIASTSTSKEAWDSLVERYEGKGAQSIVLQIGALFQTRLADEEPLESQLNAMASRGHILSSLGVPLDDSVIASAMVLALPDSYSTLRSILISTNDKPSTTAVKNSILAEERSRQITTTVPSIALKAQAGGRFGNRGRTGGEADKEDRVAGEECGYCGLRNHMTDNCRKVKLIKDIVSKEMKAKANVARASKSQDCSRSPSPSPNPIRLF
jgi:gag-polypeptide of LTR copia-type/Domain of unknown function (DUF4219)